MCDSQEQEEASSCCLLPVKCSAVKEQQLIAVIIAYHGVLPKVCCLLRVSGHFEAVLCNCVNKERKK